MLEQFQVLRDVVSRLDRGGIQYMVTGSLAMNHYAQPRMTRDLDLVVELDAGHGSRIEELFASDYYVGPESVRTAIEQRGMFNLIHYEQAVKVDLIVRKDTPYRRTEFGRRRAVQIDGLSVMIVSPEDLVLSKLVWSSDTGSEQQRLDLRNLVDAMPTLDVEYLRLWGADLGVTGALEELLV